MFISFFYLIFTIIYYFFFSQAENMEDLDEMGTTVELYVYDLTKGAAALMSQLLIGKQKENKNNFFLKENKSNFFQKEKNYFSSTFFQKYLCSIIFFMLLLDGNFSK